MDEDAILRAQHPLYDAFCREDDPPYQEEEIDYDLMRKSFLEQEGEYQNE